MVQVDDIQPGDAPPARPLFRSLAAGARGRCPACGRGRLFQGFLTVRDACAACGEPLHHQRADDFPAYLTILAAGHIVVPLMVFVERVAPPGEAVSMILWPAAGFAAAVALIAPIKGAVVGLQWALRMHGFGDGEPADPTAPTLDGPRAAP